MRATQTRLQVEEIAGWPPSRKEVKEEIERAFAGAFEEFLNSKLSGDAGKTTGITSRATGPLVTEDFLDKLRTETGPIQDAQNATPKTAARLRRTATAIDFEAAWSTPNLSRSSTGEK